MFRAAALRQRARHVEHRRGVVHWGDTDPCERESEGKLACAARQSRLGPAVLRRLALIERQVVGARHQQVIVPPLVVQISLRTPHCSLRRYPSKVYTDILPRRPHPRTQRRDEPPCLPYQYWY